RRAVALAPDTADALSRLGGFLLSVRPTKARQQEARRLLERAEALAPSNEYVWYSLGRLAMQEGNAKQAVAYFERVVAQYPDIADAWYALSRAYWRLGLSARAEQADARSRQLRRDYLERVHTQELIRLRPEDPALHLKLAHLCAKKGENAKAILEYRLCLQYAPQNQAAHQELTALMAALKARRQLPSLSLLSNMDTAMAHARGVMGVLQDALPPEQPPDGAQRAGDRTVGLAPVPTSVHRAAGSRMVPSQTPGSALTLVPHLQPLLPIFALRGGREKK